MWNSSRSNVSAFLHAGKEVEKILQKVAEPEVVQLAALCARKTRSTNKPNLKFENDKAPGPGETKFESFTQVQGRFLLFESGRVFWK